MQLLQIYNNLLSYQRILFKLVGCDMLQKDFKVVNPVSLFVMINAVIYYIVNTYSMVKFSDELVPFALVTYGVGYLWRWNSGEFYLFFDKILYFSHELRR